jgi:hypothetical protein
VPAVIVAKLDRLTRSVKDLCALLELSEKRNAFGRCFTSSPIAAIDIARSNSLALLSRLEVQYAPPGRRSAVVQNGKRQESPNEAGTSL